MEQLLLPEIVPAVWRFGKSLVDDVLPPLYN